jgi:putative NADH-flavin reductase
VRNPAKFHVSHANLRVAQGDVLRYDTIEPAVTGQDAVLSALGVRPPVFTFIVVTILCQVAARLLALHGIAAGSISLERIAQPG